LDDIATISTTPNVGTSRTGRQRMDVVKIGNRNVKSCPVVMLVSSS